MTPDLVTFAVSAGLAQVLTNIDNLLVMLALVFTLGKVRTIGGYLAAQAIVLAAALLVAEGADSGLAGNAGYLGVVPVFLGLRALWHTQGDNTDRTRRLKGSSALAATILFLGISLDSFTVMASLFADSAPAFRLAALIGAALGAVSLAVLAFWVLRLARPSMAWAARLDRLGPYAMIAAGVYVLLNTGTDML